MTSRTMISAAVMLGRWFMYTTQRP
jgi:hypothetical protein